MKTKLEPASELDIQRELARELENEFQEAEKNPPFIKQPELESKLEKASLIFGMTPPEEAVCFTIQDSEIGTLGNISAIIGKAKSRKTFLVSSFVASALTGECLGIKSAHLKGKKILWFDTEQGKVHAYKSLSRAMAMARESEQSNNFKFYTLRTFTPKERIEIIDYALLSNSDVGLVIIDGIRDLVSDINNADESTEVIGKLMKWSENKNCHILTVLHQNKGNEFARGHVGTELVNKAESTLSVEKDEEISIVRSDYTRDKDFEPFAFAIDSIGIPHLEQNYEFGQRSKQPPRKQKQIIKYETLPEKEHRNLLRNILGEKTYTTREIWTVLQAGFERSGYGEQSKSNLLNLVKEYKDYGLIIDKTPDKQKSNLIYFEV